jgi:hypothetical protein
MTKAIMATAPPETSNLVDRAASRGILINPLTVAIGAELSGIDPGRPLERQEHVICPVS